MSHTVVDYKDVLKTQTADIWLQKAVKNTDLLLIDHAHCERKAAQNAMTLIFKFPNLTNMVTKLSKIVREEMVHFEKILSFLKQKNISFRGLKSGGYATFLAKHICIDDPTKRLVDQLLIASIIEARSCERLGLLAPLLPKTIGHYYAKLHEAESRHCTIFIDLANTICEGDVFERLEFFSNQESLWLAKKDPCFRFHSGMPIDNIHIKEDIYDR
ncbi:MAG: tRNA isopentenyl-2-thiomethyl-A-37 hydroxylase MiaE [Pseudomonadota bacterium]|nr:tRNA isopentenyl-2-thiomethyl-A-37 hydroxylase MiaE [Pseudomonadota bacterium]